MYQWKNKETNYLSPGICYKVIAALRKKYGNPYKVLLASCKGINEWPMTKARAERGFRNFFSFLIKRRSILYLVRLQLLSIR